MEITNQIVTLKVNTAEINQTNIEEYCNFDEQEEGSLNKNYTKEVNIGDMIVWKGVSTSSDEDFVNIISIDHEDGKKIFGQRHLRGNGDEPELVVGIVIDHTIDEDENGNIFDNIFKYGLSFTVIKGGDKANGLFKIDPKIQVSR